MTKIYIDAKDAVMGRVASFAAKNALQGNEVVIVNSEKAVISGTPEKTIYDFKFMRALNSINPGKGPLISRVPEKIMKRAVRGMVPDYRRARGKVAIKKVKCYTGIPVEFAKEKFIEMGKGQNTLKKYITLEDLDRRA
jgi:ribosomal protein uL13